MSEEAEKTEETKPRGRRKPPARSKSVEDSGALVTMRTAKSGGGEGEGDSGEAAAADGEGEGRRARRAGRRTPARTKSSEDMQTMSKMTQYAKEKGKEGEKPAENQ